MAWRMRGGGGVHFKRKQIAAGAARRGKQISAGTWSQDRIDKATEHALERRARKLTGKYNKARRAIRVRGSVPSPYSANTPKVAASVAKLRQHRAPTPKLLPVPRPTLALVKGGWSNKKKFAVGVGVVAGAAAAYGGYKMWKRRRKNKQESLLTSLDDLRELVETEEYVFDNNEDLLLALGAASENDDELAEDLLALIDDADSRLDEGRAYTSIAYGGKGDTEAGGVFGGFGHTLGAGLGTAAAAGLSSKKRRKSLSKFGRKLLGLKKMKKRPTDAQIKKMMNQVKHVSKAKRATLEKMLRSVASANAAQGISPRRGIAMGIGGGALLGAGAMYAYNRWKKSKALINKNKQFQRPRRRGR